MRTRLAQRALLSIALAPFVAAATVQVGASASMDPFAGPNAILTATTCSGSTCQVLSGSGARVTNWYTQTTAPGPRCTYAKFLENGSLVGESGSTCLSAGHLGSTDWSNPGYFPLGTRLCTTWVGISGEACDTVL